MAGRYTVALFVNDSRTIVDKGLSADKTLAQLALKLERAVGHPDCLAGVAGNEVPDPERGFTIYRSADLFIAAIVWPENGGAPVHNHNGWALEGVISGMELNHNYQRRDDGSRPWHAELEEVSPSRVSTGETTCLSLPPNDIHSVEIPRGKTLAIHVYGVDLPSQWRYQFDLETCDVTPFRPGRPATARPAE